MMKRLKYLLILSLALLAVSCSKDDGFAPGTDDNPGGELQEFTFTVGMDYTLEGENGTAAPMANSIATRATATEDDAPTRCLMQVLRADRDQSITEVQAGTETDNGWTFTVRLPSEETYRFVFWADNRDFLIDELWTIPYDPGAVAFTDAVTGTPESVKSVIKLKRAVAKVTLVTTAQTTIAAGVWLEATTRNATEYNGWSGEVTNSWPNPYQYLPPPRTYDAGDEIVSFYVMPAAERQDITVTWHGGLEMTIADVPLVLNTHVTLKGDLSENNENWKGTPEYYEEIFNNALFDENGVPFGKASEDEPGTYDYYAFDDTFEKILIDILKLEDFDLNNAVIGTFEVTTPWDSTIKMMYNPVSLSIYIGDYRLCLEKHDSSSSYPQAKLPDVIR